MATGKVWLVGIALLGAAGVAAGQLAVEQWGAGERFAHPRTVTVQPVGQAGQEAPPAGSWIVQVDLKDLPAGAEIRHVSLHVFRPVVDGSSEQGATDVDILPLAERPRAGAEPRASGKPLALEPPWYGSFDVTEVVRGWVKNPASNFGLYVKALPGFQAERTYLEIAFAGRSGSVPAQVKGLKVFHRAGQTFLVWQEIDKRVEKDSITWGELTDLLAKGDADRRVRYRVYRHAQPITGATIASAELLGEVAPLSVYNANGRSVDELIALTRRRAIDDLDLSKRLSRTGFGGYNPDMREMAEVVVNRLAVEDGKPLRVGAGLYVHQPDKPGKACYAVAVCVDGTANCRDFSPENALAASVDETVGPGEPVLQGQADVTVFFDYPGTRQQYVQWAGPPLAHLSNQYYNWGVFIPRDYDKADVRRLSVYFHDTQQRYLKPPWPHRRDTVLLSPHDYPFPSFGYGHHEALGTLRSFNQGQVRPFLARRTDAVVEWAVRKFQAQPACVSCGGTGYWGGTAALQYGLRRPGKIAYVMADGGPDPDPRQLPDAIDRRKTPRAMTEAVWGQAEWNVKAEGGKGIWEEMDLPAYVRSAKVPLPYLSLGAGSQHITWKPETLLMQALLETRNGFMAEFFWGSSAHLHLPVTAESGDSPFEPRTDQPVLACNPRGLDLNAKFYEEQFLTGKMGYSSGARLNTKPRWRCDDVVDTPERLELTIFSGQVVYAGSDTVDTAVRNAQRFKPAAGETLSWQVLDPKSKAKRQDGEITVGPDGSIVIPGLTFGGPGRLVVQRAGATGAPSKS